jgi:hypothetical protein
MNMSTKLNQQATCIRTLVFTENGGIVIVSPAYLQSCNCASQYLRTAHNSYAFQYTPLTPYTGSPGRAATLRAFIH